MQRTNLIIAIAILLIPTIYAETLYISDLGLNKKETDILTKINLTTLQISTIKCNEIYCKMKINKDVTTFINYKIDYKSINNLPVYEKRPLTQTELNKSKEKTIKQYVKRKTHIYLKN
jgi:hypothetical protein